jgi:hypothetical protein
LEALQQKLPWDPAQDLIAVTLPPSMKEKLREATQRLPEVSVLLAISDEKKGKMRQWEVFGVTPCDAMVEAVRTAWEARWPIEFIDLEVLPGNILHDTCVRDPGWPDDWLVNKIGAEAYLDLIGAYYSLPPARIEPLDTWREFAVAHHLQTLQPFWRRILVVADAGLVRPTFARLSQPASGASPQPLATPCRFDLSTHLSLDVLLYYLDDYPQLIEQYEQCRSYGNPAGFDKPDALLRAVHGEAVKAADLKVSTRQHDALAIFLRNLLRNERRICPQPDLLYAAVQGCFGQAFAERLHIYLTRYGTQLHVDYRKRILPRSSAEKSPFWYVVKRAPQHVFVSRVCSPHPDAYAIGDEPIIIGGDVRDSHVQVGEYNHKLLRRLHGRLPRLAAEMQRLRGSAAFRGSIENGIDIRRTLRASFRGRPTLFVRTERADRLEKSIKDEPVVWILTESLDGKGSFQSSPIRSFGGIQTAAGNTESFPIGLMEVVRRTSTDDVYSDRVESTAEGDLLCCSILAYVTFGFDFDDKEKARAHFGDRFQAAFPDHGEFEHPNGCVHRDFVDYNDERRGWLTITLLTALKHARESVVVIAPPDFAVPAVVRDHQLMRGKSFVLFSLKRFSRTERDMLANVLVFRSSEPDVTKVRTVFNSLMRRFWEE